MIGPCGISAIRKTLSDKIHKRSVTLRIRSLARAASRKCRSDPKSLDGSAA
jgi:hypothetical protein